MTNGTNSKRGFGSLSEEKHKAISSKGGQRTGLKGLAYIKLHDPERFAEIIKKANEARTQQARKV